MTAFGLVIGLVFPPVLVQMGVPPDVALQWDFRLMCMGAGLLVGGVNYVLAHRVVGFRVRAVAQGMQLTSLQLADMTDSGTTELRSWMLPVDSDDELGLVATAYNDLVSEVVRAQRVERAIASVSAAAITAGRATDPAEAVLTALMNATGAGAGAVIRTTETEQRVLSSRGADAQHLLQSAESPGHYGARFTVGIDSVLLLIRSPQSDDPGLRRIVDLVADVLAIALINADLRAHLLKQAESDELTGLANRRSGFSHLLLALEQGRTGVLMIDADHFKDINDRYGHVAGDQVLRHLAETCAAALRPGDTLCRYGGEELLAVLPGADDAVVQAVGERLRSVVAASPRQQPDDSVPARETARETVRVTVRVTVSVGGASTAGTDLATDQALRRLVARADAALYSAKNRGRNRVELASTDHETSDRYHSPP